MENKFIRNDCVHYISPFSWNHHICIFIDFFFFLLHQMNSLIYI